MTNEAGEPIAEPTAQLEPPDGELFGPDALAEITLRGALVSITRRELAALPRLWSQLDDGQQHFTLERISRDYATAIEAAVEIIATAGRAHIVAEVDSVTFKDGIKAVLKISGNAPERHTLADAHGRRVFVIVCPPNERVDDADPDATKPDERQQSLDLVGESSAGEAGAVAIAAAAAALEPTPPTGTEAAP